MRFSYFLGTLLYMFSLNSYSEDISQFQRIEGDTIFFDVPVKINGYPIEQFTISIENSSINENYPFFSPIPQKVSFDIVTGIYDAFYISVSYCNLGMDDCLTYGGNLKEIVHKQALKKLVLNQDH